MNSAPHDERNSQEVAVRVAEAALGSTPVARSAIADTFVAVLGSHLGQRREEWLTGLVKGVEELGQKQGLDLTAVLADDRFVDAVVSATRTIEHTHQAAKIEALRNAVLNSAIPGAPDADTQAIMLNLVDRFTASHFRILSLWDDPPAWFESHDIAPLGVSGSRALTIEAALPEMQGRRDFIALVWSELRAAGLLSADMAGMVSPQGMLQRLTTDLGRQFMRFISGPEPIS